MQSRVVEMIRSDARGERLLRRSRQEMARVDSEVARDLG